MRRISYLLLRHDMAAYASSVSSISTGEPTESIRKSVSKRVRPFEKAILGHPVRRAFPMTQKV